MLISQIRSVSNYPPAPASLVSNTPIPSYSPCGKLRPFRRWREMYVSPADPLPSDATAGIALSLMTRSAGYYVDQYHRIIGQIGVNRLAVGKSEGTMSNYSVYRTDTVSGVTCVGGRPAICTFPSAHGIQNVLPNCLTRIIIGESSDGNWNGIFCVMSAPTLMTLAVARDCLPLLRVLSLDATTLNFQDGSSLNLASALDASTLPIHI